MGADAKSEAKSAASEIANRTQIDKAVPEPFFQLTRRVIGELWRDNVFGVAAEIAFFLCLAIPPFLMLLLIVAALANQHTGLNVVESLQGLINDNAPQESQELFNSVIDKALTRASSGIDSLALVGTLLVSIWSISNGVGALIRAANHAYGVEETRSLLRRKLTSLGLSALIIVTVNPAIILFFFGGRIGQRLADRYDLGTAFTVIWRLGRWPLAIVFIVLLLAVIYRYGPNCDQSFRWASTGSIVATALWLIGAFGFRFYMDHIGISSLYGAIGILLVALAFVYMTAFAFLVGAEINAVLARRYDREASSNLKADRIPSQVSL